jgi:hypothetical protein
MTLISVAVKACCDLATCKMATSGPHVASKKATGGPNVVSKKATGGPHVVSKKATGGPHVVSKKATGGPNVVSKKATCGPYVASKKTTHGPHVASKKTISQVSYTFFPNFFYLAYSAADSSGNLVFKRPLLSFAGDISASWQQWAVLCSPIIWSEPGEPHRLRQW